MKRAGICAGSQDTIHIHKQHRGIFRSRHCNQHRLSRNTGIYLGKIQSPAQHFLKYLYSQISLQDIIAIPDNTIPIFSVMLPSERITSPFYNCALHYSNSLKSEAISSSFNPRNSCISDNFIFPPFSLL